MDFLNIPKRTSKKRAYGLTSIADFGTPIGELKNILSDYDSMIDIAKIGIGSAYLTPNLREKLRLYKEHDIHPYFGGTLFEKCFYQRKLPEYLASLHDLGIEWVEISNGTLDIPIEKRLDLIKQMKQEFHVIAEVGSKDSQKDMSIGEWKAEIKQLLEAGASYVITEGRDSGTAGIYESSGKIKSDLIQALVEDIDWKKIIFEAQTPKHQMYFINEIGPNVNLGNVKIHDALILESQRCGLRSETFYLEDTECRLPL
jgi:phosphosulfolactate synthase